MLKNNYSRELDLLAEFIIGGHNLNMMACTDIKMQEKREKKRQYPLIIKRQECMAVGKRNRLRCELRTSEVQKFKYLKICDTEIRSRISKANCVFQQLSKALRKGKITSNDELIE